MEERFRRLMVAVEIHTLVLSVLIKLIDGILVTLLLHRPRVLPTPLVHAINTREHGLLHRVDDAKNILSRGVRIGPPGHALLHHLHDVGGLLVIGVLDGEVERAGGCPAKGGLQGHVQGVEGERSGAGEGAFDGWVDDMVRRSWNLMM